MSIKLPTISWEVIISNTSVVSGENYRYTCTLSPVNINDPGYGQLEVGYYIVDYIGHIFKIEEVTGYDIKVHDLLEDTQFSGPYNDQNGYVYSSLKEAALVVQAKLNRLDKSAEDFVRSLALDPKILEVDGIAYDTEFESDLDYEGLTKWNPENNTLDIHTGKTAVLQVGQEIHIKVYNDTAETISNGTAVHPTGGYNGFPTIGKALAKTHETINLDYGITTTEIASGEYGFVTWFGKIHNVDTSSYSLGDVLYISPDTAGEVTNVKPTFPNYSIQVGIVFKVGATDGVVFVTGRDDYQNTIRNFWNGTFREPFRFYVTSDGTDITGTLYSDNGYDELTMMFSTGFEMLSLDPNPTVTITAGTDTNPQHNFIYIPLSTKQLTSSTTGFPIEEHIKVACVYVKSAAFTQSEGALKNHNWSDNIQGVLHNQGYLSKITERLRQEHAKWHSGCELSVTVDTNTTPDSVYLSATSGSVYEIIKEAFEAKNMATGDIAHVVNHPTTPWISISNLNELDVTAEGDPLYNHCFSLVVWGVANKATEPSHLKINLPRGTYAKNDAETAINDPYNYSIYEIPDEFTGVGFLIARVTLSVGPAGNVWTLEDLEDLRGQIPNSTAGGGTGGSGASTFLGLGDTPNSYLGHANKVPSVSDDETGLEFVNFSTEYLVVNTFQTAHGFTNDFIYHNGLNWVKAQANSGETCATHYAIRIDDDNFKLIPVGELDLGSLTDENGDPLVVGEYYFLSQTNAGKITGTKPTDGIIQSVLKSNSTGKITVSIQEPYDINDVGGGSGVDKFIDLTDVQSPYVADKFLKVNGTADGIIYVDEPESMVYPDAGIPISTGSAWSTSIVDNSSNWNDAYDHSILVTGNPHAVTFSQLGGNPSDVITAGTNLSWDGNTLNASGGGSVTFGSENEIPTVNSTTDGFDYDSNFKWDGARLIIRSSMGSMNTIVGYNTGESIITGAGHNTMLGYNVGNSITDSDANTLIGYGAGYQLDDDFNTLIGAYAGAELLTGNSNIFIGYAAGGDVTGNNANVFIGSYAGYNNNGSGSVFLGNYAGRYETSSNKLYIHNDGGGTESNGREISLIYGEFNSTVSSQWLRINGQFQLKDGLTAPSTVSGYAQIYVDSADGDLKVKFGDGTVKTIVTDS